jgi:lipopolysaccharide transport system ATP-binding protein
MVGLDPARRPIRITEIELLGEDGRPRTVFDHGERMRVRLSFEASERIANPNFCVSFIRSDNVACCNFNMAMDGFTIPFVSGSGTIELSTPPLKLVSELYTTQVMVWDTGFERLYTAQMGRNFHVQDQLLSTHFGVFHEPGEWRWPAGEGRS